MTNLNAQVEKQRCQQCGRKPSWDGQVHRSVFTRALGIGAVKGEVHLFCAGCNEADSYFLGGEWQLLHSGRIRVDGPVPGKWLTDKINRQEFDAYVADVLASPDSLESFKARLRIFISRIATNDEVWSFASPAESFANLMGCAGFAVLSGSGVVACSLVMMSN